MYSFLFYLHLGMIKVILNMIILIKHKVYREFMMHLNLTWPKFSDHVREVFQDVMTSADFTDVTIVCDDQEQFRAHKLVLSACSPVFRRIISCLPTKDAVIYMKGVKHKEMKSILEFIYLGQSTFYEDRLDEFLKVARDLDIKEIGENGKSPTEQDDCQNNEKSLELIKMTNNEDSEEGVHNFESSMDNLSGIDIDDITCDDDDQILAKNKEVVNSSEIVKEENTEIIEQDNNTKDSRPLILNLESSMKFENVMEIDSDANTRQENQKISERNYDDPSGVTFKFLASAGRSKDGVLVTNDGSFIWHKSQSSKSGDRIYYFCADKPSSGCKARAIVETKTVKIDHGEEVQRRLVSISSYEVSIR